MSMTREEIIKEYEGAVVANGLAAAAGNEEAVKSYELFKAGLDALRPVSREAWTAEWTVDEVGHKCSKCGEYLPDGEDVRKPQFCPECGRAMTDEAVDMVMERMEKIK